MTTPTVSATLTPIRFPALVSIWNIYTTEIVLWFCILQSMAPHSCSSADPISALLRFVSKRFRMHFKDFTLRFSLLIVHFRQQISNELAFFLWTSIGKFLRIACLRQYYIACVYYSKLPIVVESKMDT